MSADRAGTATIADAADYQLSADATLRRALPRLWSNPAGLGIVVGGDGDLAGTLTDAGVRRAVLRGADLEGTTVGQVMSRNSVRLDSEADAASVLLEHRLRAVPVVVDGRVTGVAELAAGSRGPALDGRKPVAVLMVGGRGERLRPLTDKVPKPLLRIGGRAIVERLLLQLAAAGIDDAYLTVNYLAEQFEEYLGDGADLGIRLHYVRETEPLGTAGSLSLLPELPPGPIIVANGDLVTTVDFQRLLDFHWHHRGSVTVCGVEHRTHVPYGVLQTVEHHLLGIAEKPERIDFVSAGIYVLEPETLRFVQRGRAAGMPDLIDAALGEGQPVHVFPLLEGWYDIGSPEEFERVLLQFATGEES